jgi:enediyne biosynthesis protein E4
MPPFHWFKRWLKPVSAVLILASLYFATQLPRISARERLALTSHFQFQRSVLPQVPGYPAKTIRSVNPRLAGISAWISSVGASVALNDLDGDGLPNDLCYVDTRADQVIVAPVPGTPPRYKPFVLNPGPLPYDSNTMAPMGCLPLDANEDGLMDIVIYYWGRSPVVFLQQYQQAKELRSASFKPQELMPSVQDWYTNAAVATDLDGDGHIDLIFGNYFADGSRVLDAHSTYPA